MFVDFEEGQVSFYETCSPHHIFSFIGNAFTEKLYPYINPGCYGGDNSAPLVISPVNQRLTMKWENIDYQLTPCRGAVALRVKVPHGGGWVMVSAGISYGQ